MGFFSRKKAPVAHVGEINPSEKPTPAETPATLTPANNSQASLPIQHNSNVVSEAALKELPVTMKAVLLGAISSLGGFMFGYESGQISGLSSRLVSRHVRSILISYRFLADERFSRAFRRGWKFQCSTTRNNCCTFVCRNIGWVLSQWMDL